MASEPTCPECKQEAPGGECAKCEVYLCAGCAQWKPWSDGGADDMPAHCDDCWAKAHAKAFAPTDAEAARIRSMLKFTDGPKANEIATVERCRHCGCEWVCPDCGGVAGAQPPTETHAPPEVWSGTIDGYRFAVRVEPAEIGPDVAIAVLLQTRAPEIVLDDDHARRVIAVALRDLRRRAGEAERERDRAHEEIDEHASAIERADEMRATVAKLERERDAAKAIADAWAEWHAATKTLRGAQLIDDVRDSDVAAVDAARTKLAALGVTL